MKDVVRQLAIAVAGAACIAAVLVSTSAAGGSRCAAANRLVAESNSLPAPLRVKGGAAWLKAGAKLVCARKWGGATSTSGKNTYLNTYGTSPWAAIEPDLSPSLRDRAEQWVFHVAYFAYTSIVPHEHIDDFGYAALGVAACQVERWSIERLAFTKAIPLLRTNKGLPAGQRNALIARMKQWLSKSAGLRDGKPRAGACQN